MARKVFVEIKTRVIFNLDEGIEVGDVVSDLDYDFKSGTDGAQVMDTEIVDFEVTDSK